MADAKISELTAGIPLDTDVLPYADLVSGETKKVLKSDLGSNASYFGDGNDGDVTISEDTTLTRTMYYNNLTINSTKILNTGGLS